MNRVIVIVGQTASGKSNLAVEIAKKINGEIISADSRQVYTGLDIGTGKITMKEMRGVPHWGLDIANPKRKFTVAQYKKYADKKIREILVRGHTPIICGGTGFYVDAVVTGMVLPEIKANPKLRKTLAKNTPLENFNYLKKLDPKRAQSIDQNNNMRLIRAIEIALALGSVPKPARKARPANSEKSTPKYDFLKIGIAWPKEELAKRIEKRVKKMFEDGLLDEIEKLKNFGVKDNRLKELGFEYYNPTLESVILATKQYAKRQMTWFKRDKDINWLSPLSSNSIDVESSVLEKLLQQHK